jgi:hypothetical protein
MRLLLEPLSIGTFFRIPSPCETTLNQVPARTCGQMRFHFLENIHCGGKDARGYIGGEYFENMVRVSVSPSMVSWPEDRP